MATTTRDALRYPALSDSPDVVRDITNLATDVEGALHRAYPCTSTTRPTGIDEGFLIRESDTGAVLVWDGADWQALGAGVSGGGSGGSLAYAQFSASSAQSVANATDVTCGFGTADTASSAVTRAVRAEGHQFTLNTAGLWTITATVRYSTTTATGERYAGIHTGSGGGQPLAGAGSNPSSGSSPVTLNVAVTRYFTASSTVFVNLYQGTGNPLALEPGSGGGWVRLNFGLVG